MSSGSLNINTFSWYRELPLSNDITGYPSTTMFAVGPSNFMVPYTFYQYTSTSGFIDTSTLTTIFNSSLTSTVNYLGKIFVSTIPYTKWVSTNQSQESVYERTYPYYYPSTFPCTVSTFISTIDTPPFTETFVSTSTTDPNGFGPFTSTGRLAQSYPFNFVSTNNEIIPINPDESPDTSCRIQTSNLWIGEGMTDLINSKKYNVFVNQHYSLYVSTVTSTPPSTWISTSGLLASDQSFSEFITGRTANTRIQNLQYVEVTNTLMFKPETFASQREMGIPVSYYNLNIFLQSTVYSYNSGGPQTSNVTPAFDIYIPGENNFTFTLVPVLSTVIG